MIIPKIEVKHQKIEIGICG